MTRYEEQKDEFLIYLMGKNNVYHNLGSWLTSDSKYFKTISDAIKHEIERLKGEID